uniref:ATP-dependent RNA helicase n=1 Tax=Musca domestica TaxID=7370 RepID=A0A1I8M743_MUSDO
MTIELNITTAKQPMRSKPEEVLPPPTKKKSKNSASSGFSFEFGGGTQKVKAVVARRRPVAGKTVSEDDKPKKTTEEAVKPKSMAIRRKVDTKPTKPNGQSVALKRKATDNISEVPKKNFVAAPQSHQDDGDSDLESYARVPKTKDLAGDLMLNICTAPTGMVGKQQGQKAKLTRQERLQQKRSERQGGDGQLKKRTLSDNELKAGIRKFSKNPNQKPRAADLFVQREREEREALKAKEDSSPVEEPELGHVDPQARKNNAFRVKRPGDSSVRKIGLFKDQPEKVELGQRFVKPITEKIFDNTKVESLDLHAHTVKNLADILSITHLTTVQKKTIPKALEGRDLLVRSQTGSGKTLAYALPLVEKLHSIR